MRNATAQPLVRTLLEHLAEHRSFTTAPAAVPAAHYTDPSHATHERTELFVRRPQVVALSPDLPEPGSFITRDTLAVPLLVTRKADGTVAAFANVCAHRGAEVVTGDRGCQRRFACPYHGWTYDLAGTLVGQPDRAAFAGRDHPTGLRALPAHEADGVIWVVPDVNADPAAPIDPALGPVAADIASYVDGTRPWRQHRFELALNWKLVVDTFLEPYHFATLHRRTVGPLFVPNLCVAERIGDHVREVLPRRTITEIYDQEPASWDLIPHSALVHVLFPNTVLVMQLDHVETWRVAPDPLDPGRSICDLDFYIPTGELTPSASRHWERNWELTINTVIEEDFHAMAGVQRGLASGALDVLSLGANEPALSYFHAALADALATTV